MTKNQYNMDGTELFLHQLINDTSVKFDQLELDEVVRDLAKLNWIKQEFDKNEKIDFYQCIVDYRLNLLHHLENI